jgi:alpha-mannosidase
MQIEELVVLLPCHSLEDFPVHHEGAEAEGLLAAWSGLWHPSLIVAAGGVPVWFRADAPPENLRNRLIVVPQVCDSLLLPGWPTRAKTEGAVLLRKLPKRPELVAAALALLESLPPTPAEDLVADFYALGTAYLLVELLTRQMRYMSNLDETRLFAAAKEGAAAAVEGRDDDARQHLKNAFEALYEGRERFYPVDNYLVDLTLTAETTIGPSLRRELAGDTPLNLLLTGALLERIAEREPESLSALRHAVDRRVASVVGGEYDDRDLTLLSPEVALAELRRGLAAYERHLGSRPTVFGRRRQGLTPLVPALAARHGFEGVLAFTLDDGQVPTVDQGKTRWEGFSNDAVDALTRAPVDAARAETFLELPRHIGESMDRDYVATVVFAHWPGNVSPYYDDIRRMTNYAPILGKFITLADYFDHTERPGSVQKLDRDKFRTTSLRQAVVRNVEDPISWVADAHRRRLRAESIATLGLLASSVRLRPAAATPAAAELLAEVDMLSTAGAETAKLAELDRRIDTALDAAARETGAALSGSAAAPPASASADGGGLLLLNTHLAPRRELVDVSALSSLPAVGGAVVAVDETADRRWAVVDVPSLGYAWLSAAPPAPKPRKGPKPIVEETRLRNDLFEAHVSTKTGGLQGVYIIGARGNRLSQQLSFRLPSPRQKPGDVWRDPDAEPIYSSMVAESLETTQAGPLVGEITSRGRLIDGEGRKLAGFVQRVRVVRGLPLIWLDIELEIDEQPRAEAWGSYYAARFAWNDESADLGRGVFLMHQPTKAARPESPYFLEIETSSSRTQILPGGLPYHLSVGHRMLDVLLVGKGERRRRFTLTAALDRPDPSSDALAVMEPLVAVPGAAKPAGPPSGRLFAVDARHVVATHWEPIVEGERTAGFRCRLMETIGDSGPVELHAVRKITTARLVDGRGQTLVDLPAGDDRVSFELGAHEWIELEAKFA